MRYMEVINCSLNNTDIADLQISGGQMMVINTTFNQSKVKFSDTYDHTNLTLQYYLNVKVQDELGVPIPDANILVNNRTGRVLVDNFTRPSGWLKWQPVTTYVQRDINGDGDGKDPGEINWYGMHNITVSKAGYDPNYTELNITDNEELVITLYAHHVPVNLNNGWNLICPPVDIGISRASEWAGLINADIQPGNNVSEIVRWENRRWTSWIAEVPGLSDFQIMDGCAYFVNINGSGTPVWEAEGEFYSSSQDVQLDQGWNSIGLPYSDFETAQDILDDNDNISLVANWTNSAWELWDGLAGSDFNIQAGFGQKFPTTANANGVFVFSGKNAVLKA